jgi:glyoxylase-like metal-dependent hydrolase (beta-lactamase superfamily II)
LVVIRIGSKLDCTSISNLQSPIFNNNLDNLEILVYTLTNKVSFLAKENSMKVTTHGQYLVQLTRLAVINCYFVREDDGLTLIDTGIPGSAEAILEAARTISAPIVRIALTHAHADHVGSLDALHQLLPEAEVLITARDARFLAGERSLEPNEPQEKLRGSYTTCTTTPTRLLAHGDHIGSLEVIASPGHTPGHAAFFDLRDRTLIAGDALQTQGGVAVAGQLKLFFPLPALATWHKPTALQSAQTLRSLNPSRLAVGHGPVLNNPLPAMDEAIRAAARNIGEAQRVH